MIPVQNAIELIRKHSSLLSSEAILIEEGIGQVVSEDVFSPIHMPPFDQSAMDGYAVNGLNLESYQVIGEIQAGDSGEGIELKAGEAVRIFTGAVVPKSVQTVVKQEIVERNGEKIVLTEAIRENQNIRYEGEQIKQGEIALPKGALIKPSTAGFLYMLGLTEVKVYQKPKVTIIATGNELVPPGQPLTKGKIYESNTYTLKTALKELGIDADILTVQDNYVETRAMLKQVIDSNDILITSGGISVGDYDFVGKALNEIGVETIFYKVKQKPGKPLLFGKKNNTLVFAVPGNPAAALSCFYMYVTSGIKKMMGYQEGGLEKRTVALTTDYTKTPNLSHFLKGSVEGNKVSILGAQSSAMLSSFSVANCLIYLPQDRSEWSKGDEVEVFILP